jgi:nitrogen fixation NifU-like protein
LQSSGNSEGSKPDFGQGIADLQKKVADEERLHYSAKVLEQAYNPKNMGRMPNPDAFAAVRGWCGDTMVIYLRLEGDRIDEARFMTDGCGPTVACGSMLTTVARGLLLDEALKISADDLIAALDGLPDENAHCATLAVSTLREAIAHRQGEVRN